MATDTTNEQVTGAESALQDYAREFDILVSDRGFIIASRAAPPNMRGNWERIRVREILP